MALSVDGLNAIDARQSDAWDASKWLIRPDQTLTVSGWQVSTDRARRFYFTTERDSYGRLSTPGLLKAIRPLPPCEESVRGLLPTDLPIDVTSRS